MSDAGRADALLAGLPGNGRGRLKVYLGAAAGVGKTCAMLRAAHHLQRQGVKVLAAVVETHGRAGTEALLVGLARQPLARLRYRERTLEELDLDAVLAARPALALVDELAHSNAPGSRHGKRWQDVHELLAAGIDVHTTVNVQHLESLNDQVRGITGVQVRETVPDWVLLEAHELVLVDLPPRELLERLREGKVYMPEQARAAIEAFFTPTHLSALRELAMQTAAAQVDGDLAQGYRRQGVAAPSVRGRLLVAVNGDGQAERLVRHASRVAQRRHLPWSLVYVDTGQPGDPAQRQRLQAAQQLAERLGGEVVLLRGAKVAAALLRHAGERRASVLLLGTARARRWRLGVPGQVLRAGPGLEVALLGRDSAAHAQPARRPSPARPREYLLALLAPALAAALAWGVNQWLALPNLSLVFLMAVLLVAVRGGLGPALLSAGLSFLLYDFLFIAPLFSLSINLREDLLTLLFFLLMATVTGNLATAQRRQWRALGASQAHTHELLELSRRLAAATDRAQVLEAARRHFEAWPQVSVVLAERGPGNELALPPGASAADHAAAAWAWQHGQAAGQGSATLPASAYAWWPLLGEQGTLALVGLRSAAGPLSDERRRLLAALCQPLAQALARAHLAEQLEAARLHGETEQLRSALLASVSHDLRTPLTAMRGSIESLQLLGAALSPADRDELLESTRLECERLDRYIQNLLDMTRLGHGALALARDWVAVADIVASATQRLRAVLAPLRLEAQLAEPLPLLYVHAALIEQALVNVLENAARFSPAGGLVRVSAQVQAGELRLAVSDQGPGIPLEERARVFDLFYTAARGDRGGQGTGLGLAICQGMVGAHGGRVEVADGDAGRGTCIALCLPLHPGPAAQGTP
ncbi:DUF4118 domain-containing protein [Pseudomonas sp. NPDC007930]|uniref:DUF4118 domain-containing protein n=1 Tax=Pseudomonas sp. NPDC007930 TaxID=3364417 RepID=UPI0036E6DACF